MNETLVQLMGWDQPIGQVIEDIDGIPQGQVIGVVEDFHFASLHEPLSPLVLSLARNNFQNSGPMGRRNITQTLVLDIGSEGIAQTIEYVREVMQEFDPDHPFAFEFLDSRLNELYQSDTQVMSLTAVFSAICIFISCLGVFGLASFTTEQRSKEIGIRKVLGASPGQIIMLLSRSVLIMVLASAVLASFISYFAVNEWLTGFAYRDAINPLTFFLATALALLIAFITIALQSIKTVYENPVIPLRYE